MTVPVKGRGPQVAGAAGLFVALSTVAVLLRCYCRVIIVKQFGLDDWLTFISWVCSLYLLFPPYTHTHTQGATLDAYTFICLQVLFVFYCTFSIAGTHHGTGQHAYDLPPNELPIGLKVSFPSSPSD